MRGSSSQASSLISAKVIMSSANTSAGPAPAQPGLFSRAIGVILSPKATFEKVIVHPKWFGAALAIGLLGALIVGGFMMTQIGQSAWLDQAVSSNERMGRTVSDQQYAA